MAKRTRAYIWQFVIGLGFLSGLWTAIGIDPEALLLGLLGTAAEKVFPDPAVRTLFLLLPTALLLVSLWGAYRKGRVMGLLAVLVAYCAGLAILVSTGTALVILAVAVVIGVLATSPRASRKLRLH